MIGVLIICVNRIDRVGQGFIEGLITWMFVLVLLTIARASSVPLEGSGISLSLLSSRIVSKSASVKIHESLSTCGACILAKAIFVLLSVSVSTSSIMLAYWDESS